MILHESMEMYLETILILQERLHNVRAIDIAKEMNFSKPTVSIALKKLKENDYVDINDHTNYVTLTEKGLAIANNIYDKHKTLTDFLVSIGVSKENAANDACKIEHDISEETFLCIKKYLKQD
ncbi:MAG: metal-dependent transcriptional regulator [Erysipelotrichaceae bacterium]|nr:metal-dependent transcriptional regulator [Erysipelotrichaceae bacterium]MDY5998523.1 metal-dependent transcriptional regulator [Erysipelotrichaceae bacterium]